MRCILNMKMKKTDYIRILSLLLAASVLMGGCSSRSAQQSAQTSQPVQQETQVEEEPSETSEQDQQQEQEPQETSEEDQQQNDFAQEEAPPQDEVQTGEEADNPSEQAPENTEETEENAEQTEDAASNGSTYTAEQYMQYDQFVEPLRTSQILQQDFSPEQPPAFGNHVWYGLTVYGFDPILSAYAGQDGNGHFAAETIEGLIMEHFDVTPEQIRADNDAYSEEFGTYIEPQGLGGYTPDFGISGADREGNTLVLVVDQYTDQNKIFHTSVLTIQLESEDTTETEDAEETEETTGGGEDTFTTWKYLSNQTIYDNQAAWE